MTTRVISPLNSSGQKSNFPWATHKEILHEILKRFKNVRGNRIELIVVLHPCSNLVGKANKGAVVTLMSLHDYANFLR
jgi:hypothetical protein